MAHGKAEGRMSDIHRALNKFCIDHLLMWQEISTLAVEYRENHITQERFAARVSAVIAEHNKLAAAQKEALEVKS